METRKWKVVLLVVAVMFIGTAAYVLTNPGVSMTTSTQGDVLVKSFSSLEKLETSYGKAIDIPEVFATQKGLKYEQYPDGSINIYNDMFSYREGKLIAENVNISGIHGDEFLVNETYSVSQDSNNAKEIKTIRFQATEYETALSWFSDDMMYGIRLEDYDWENGKEALYSALGFDKLTLSKESEAPTTQQESG